MKIKYLVAALALSLPSMLSAVPADPRVRTYTNPDGSTMQVRVHGDEFFSFMTDADCTRIIERNDRGFLVDKVYAGRQLAFNKANVEMLKAEALSANPIVAQRDAFNAAAAAASGQQRMATLNVEGRSNYPTVGEGNRSLVVLVEFSDMEFFVDDPKDYFTRQLNEPGFSDYGGQGSAVDYYKDASNGLYLPQFDVYGPVKLDRAASFFQDTKTHIKNMDKFVKESLTAVNALGEVDFSNYDLDEDGVIDTVFFYYAGYGSADSDTETIWPHQADYRWYSTGMSLKFGGKTVGPYACANEVKGWNPYTYEQSWKDGSEPWIDGIGTFVHEYGHVLGLPDMYDVNDTDTPTPGEWDVMDQGSYNGNGCIPPLMSAYEQWVCRWLEFVEPEDGVRYDITALANTESPYALRVPIPTNSDGTSFANEYFVIEARDNSKWDFCFPDGGMMVWRINYNKNIWTNNNVNTNGVQHVEIVYPEGNSAFPIFTEGNIYPEGEDCLVPSREYKFWKHPYITSIAYDKDTKTASLDYNVITEAPTGAPLLHDNPYADEGTARNFTIEWDPLEGADSYLITIKRVSTDKVLGIYDEYDLGDETSCHIVNVPTSYWNNELEVYVRAVKAIPCSDTSNKIRFVPAELPRGEQGQGGAVDAVEGAGSVVAGGKGCVIAPEGAKVYDMAGKLLQKDSLLPGVYVVVAGEKTHKVIVR